MFDFQKIQKRFYAWRISEWLLSLFVFSWPIARFLKQNGERLIVSSDLWIVFFGFCLIFGGLIFCVRGHKKAGLSILIVFIYLFTFTDFHMAAQRFPAFVIFYKSWGGRLIFIWGGFLAGILWLTWRLENFRKIIVPFLWIFVGVAWLEVLPSLLTHRAMESKAISEEFSSLTLRHKPNIYFLMIDGYPGEKTLQEVMSATGLQPRLRQKGFVVPRHTRSNYHFTLYSLSSQFQMNYHMPDGQGILGKNPDLFSYPIVGKNHFVRVLKKNGYQFVFAPSGALAEISCQGIEDTCLSPGNSVEVFRWFWTRSPLLFLPILRPTYLEPKTISSFVQKRAKRGTRPVFVFAHFMQVHDLVRTRQGKVRHCCAKTIIMCNQKAFQFCQSAQEDISDKILRCVDTIKKQDPDALIVISSDHGIPMIMNQKLTDTECEVCWLGFDEKMNHHEVDTRFQNLISIYVPPQLKGTDIVSRYFYDGTSNVNVFRGVLALLSGENIRALPDRHFILAFDETKKVYSVKKEHHP